jgi:2-succinyl-6-hydroxy-2,4-cyclohexadiene-1-carboxylate synthase
MAWCASNGCGAYFMWDAFDSRVPTPIVALHGDSSGMIQRTRQTDEIRGAGAIECWCLHGAVGSAGDWREFAAATSADSIASRAVDLWRFLACEPMSLARFGEALNAEANDVGAGRAKRVLVGYSMGGRLALHALARADSPWDAAVIVSAHPGLEDADERRARLAQDAGWAAKSFGGEWRKFLEEWNAQSVIAGDAMRDADASAGLVMRRREIARSFVDWSLGAQEPMWGELGQIKVPVLWVVGERDEKFHGLGRRAVSLMPQARLLVTPDCGHRVPWDCGEWFAARVAEFVRASVS